MRCDPVSPVLVDLAGVPECHCNDALDFMAKAMAELPDGDDTSIWRPVENPYLTAHVEAVTARFQAILHQLLESLSAALWGKPITDLAKAMLPWLDWSETRFEEVRTRLESKPSSEYTPADWTLLVDWLIARYLPDGVIQSEAEYLTVRAALLGKIEAAQQGVSPTVDMMEAWNRLTPTSFAAVPPRILSPIELGVLDFAKERAATNIGMVAEATRARMRGIVLEHVQAQLLGQKEGRATTLKTRLFDEFGVLNRDFRRIAVTEAGECCSQGFIAAQPVGAKVRRMEAYRGACQFCRSINGKVFDVIDPATPDREAMGQTAVWLGKTNVGRSASPMMRVNGGLVERGINQRWWPAAGVQHPHCRGAWVALPQAKPNVSPVFAAYMGDLAAKFRAQSKPFETLTEL